MSLQPDNAAASQPQPDPSARERYRGSFDFNRFPVGEGEELVYSPLTRQAMKLSNRSVRLIQGCRTFATLDEHAAGLCRELNLGPLQADAVRNQLGELARAGFLVPLSKLLGMFRRGEPPTPARITTLAVPTRDRTQSLERCLTSFITNARRHERALDIVVADDSGDPTVRSQNRALLEGLKTRHAIRIFYAGPEERARFADALARHADLPRDDVRFGVLNEELCPVSTGASRNALLLHAVGEALLQVDDDTICHLAPVRNAQAGLALSSERDPTEFWFPGEQDPLPPGDGEPDFLALHEKLLGKGLGDCLTEIGPDAGPNLDRAGAGFFRALEHNGGQVLATVAGVMGDSGMGAPTYFLSLAGPSRERLLRTEEAYRRVLYRQQVQRAVTRPTVSDGTFCMALNLGLDNRDLLPPFTPFQRNQDGVFAVLLRTCFAGGYIGLVPWMVHHQAPAPRVISPEEFWRSATQVTTGQILHALVSSFSPGPHKKDRCKNLQALGRSLEEWGSAAPADFEELVSLLLWNQASRRMGQLESQLRAANGQPAFWADDVRRYLAAMREALADRKYAVPHDLADMITSRQAPGFLQHLVRRFGRFLQIWPNMVVAAKELRGSGHSVAVEV
jgi:hypothetical protein